MKIDPAAERVIAIIPVGDGPSTLVAGGNSLWVSDEFDATLDRIDLRTARVISAVRSSRGHGVPGAGV